MAKTKAKNNGKYYNGEMVLSEAERINAGIIMVTSNRSDGKTTWFLKEAKRRFLEYGHQLMLVYRYKYELSASAELFDGVQQLEEDDTEFTCKSFAQGMIYKIYYGDEPFGFAVALSNPDVIKKYSALFSKVEWMLMDEYQSESGKYLPNEVEKLQSVYTSINRGGGYQSRDVKVILLGNMVSELNPYWIMFDITKRLRPDTKLLRSDGMIAEFHFNENAAKALKSNAFNRAMKDTVYAKYSQGEQWLINANTFIEKPKGKSSYLATIVYEGHRYGVREYYEEGYILVSTKCDPNFKKVISFKPADHNQNTMMLNHYSYFFETLHTAFKQGYLRFDSMQSKNTMIDILGIDLYK